MIPKKIHYCWFGNKPLPNEVKKCIKSWKKYCPDYEIIQWNETNFDVKSNEFVKSAYEAKAWAFVSDFARLKIIYENGGIYLDTDVELLKNLDTILNCSGFFGVQQSENQINTGLGFGAEKKSIVVEGMINEYNNIKYNNDIKNLIACPVLNTRALEKLGYKYNDQIQVIGNVYIYPPKFFDPFDTGTYARNLRCEDTISIHHYSASWMDKKTRIKRCIVRTIGEDKICIIKRIFRYGEK